MERIVEAVLGVMQQANFFSPEKQCEIRQGILQELINQSPNIGTIAFDNDQTKIRELDSGGEVGRFTQIGLSLSHNEFPSEIHIPNDYLFYGGNKKRR